MAALENRPTDRPVAARLLRRSTGLLLAMVTLAVFWPTVHCEFLNFDDPQYVVENRQVLAGLTPRSVAWAFRATYASNWHPLTWLSHMLDVELFGPGPRGPHATNWLLHAANTVLVFVVLRRFTGAHWRSTLVAAWFGLHPLHVESVAWVSERKDLLSAFFGLLSLWAYGRFAEIRNPKSEIRNKSENRTPESEALVAKNAKSAKELAATDHGPRTTGHEPRPIDHKRTAQQPLTFYALALAFFACGLMSKPMLVTLPFVMLLLDFWPLQRISFPSLHHSTTPPLRLILEKLPFFFLSAVCSTTTFLAQAQGGAVVSLDTFSFLSRLENAIVSYARYLGKTVWPVDLAVFYPHPKSWPGIWVGAACALVGGLTWLGWRAGRRNPFVITGWLWFLGMLVPVIGLIQVGPQAMADRYAYLPSIGLFICLVWGAGRVVEHGPRSSLNAIVAAGVAVLTVAAFGARTRDQLRHWQDSGTLFNHALAVTRNNGVALGCLGQYEQDHGRVDEAIKLLQQSRAVGPYGPGVLNNLGNALAAKGRTEEAVVQFRLALEMDPDSERTLNNLGNALVRLGREDEALENFRQALRLAPDFLEAHKNLALALAKSGRLEEATEHFREALRLQPGDPETLNNLGSALARLGRLEEAMTRFRGALRLAPDFVEARKNLGLALIRLGRPEEALEHLRRAQKLNSNDADTLNYIGGALVRLDRRNEAIESFKQALKIDPNHADAQRNLSRLSEPSGGNKP